MPILYAHGAPTTVGIKGRWLIATTRFTYGPLPDTAYENDVAVGVTHLRPIVVEVRVAAQDYPWFT